MKKLSGFRRWLLMLLFIIPVMVFAQDNPKLTKKQKKAEQKKEQRAQNAKKAEVRGKKRHMKLQDKQTRKRMKQNKKKGTAYVSRRPGFFQRLFKPFR
jgi:ATP-dependent exoDNAse (exonuclease V) alpha subunit